MERASVMIWKGSVRHEPSETQQPGAGTWKMKESFWLTTRLSWVLSGLCFVYNKLGSVTLKL
jgi:hypothetical protein